MHIQLSDIATATVIQYPYRTARLTGDLIERRQYNFGDEASDLEQALAHAAGAATDNHTIYKIMLADGHTVYVQFSDWKATFATGVIDRRW